ncbi:tetratricopeptide repeat protein [Burkholderia sp. FERM BP-3421]|uniref:tetratricopeptide repeat protein n=1 Tax=Burkholderia sp. FERM BP-3421 TaxID=1494466 RepID=UPI00235FBD4A|nr:tetratricopeptide repeat protein [Burkholderia sp. FERM BP-3421]WDD93018.1 tetratricopeptide repeat protein [Burkholderia sp. FERM BP-3421]
MPSLKNIHQPKEPGLFSIIFVHGLDGDPEQTWMSRPKDPTTLWPRWVGEESGCDTWVLGYDAKLSGWRSAAMSLPDQGTSVLDRLEGHKALRNRPLILVGHSMGGLVIKTAIVHAMTHDVARYANLVRWIRGVVFLATPHQGSDLANLAMAFKGLLRTNVQVGDLTANNTHLLSLNRQFNKQYGELGFRVRSFAETHGVELQRRLLKWLPGPRVMVVPAGSSDPHVPGEVPIPIDADHFSICKPATRQGDQVHDSLIAFIADLPRSREAQAEPPPHEGAATPAASPEAIRPAPSDAPRQPGRLSGCKDARLRPREGEVLGRADEVAAVLAFLHSSDDSAVVFAHVTGCGGIGKTEVCKAALEAWLKACPEQTAFYVDVPDEANPADLPGLMGRALGVDDVADGNSLAQVLVPGLYYLDNLESVAEQEDGIRLLREVQKIQGVRLLASSRVDLTGVMSRPIRIDALPLDAATALFRKLWTGDAPPPDDDLRRFVSDDLGCHALSVTLIARLGNAYPFADLVARWRSVGVALAEGRLIDSRLDSLSISLCLTKDALQDQPGALQLWMLAALFPDGVDSHRVSAFEEAGGWPDAARQALTRHHVWKLRGDRFHLLPPVARFALDGFSSEGAKACWSEVRLIAFAYFDCLAEAADSIVSTDESLRARAQLLSVFEAVHRMISRELRLGAPGDGVLEALLHHLDPTLQFRPTAAAEILRASLPHMKQPALMLARLGDLETRQGNPEASQALYARALHLYEAAGDVLGTANTLQSLGNLGLCLSEFDEAQELLACALTMFLQAGDRQGQANTHRSLAELERRLGHGEAAREQYHRAFSLYEQQGDSLGQANALYGLGLLLIEQDGDDARVLLERAEAIFVRVQDSQGQGDAQQALGDVERCAGNAGEALAFYRSALELYARGGDLAGAAHAHSEIARCHAMLNEERERNLSLTQAWRAAKASNIESVLRYVLRVLVELAGSRESAEAWLANELGETG